MLPKILSNTDLISKFISDFEMQKYFLQTIDSKFEFREDFDVVFVDTNGNYSWEKQLFEIRQDYPTAFIFVLFKEIDEENLIRSMQFIEFVSHDQLNLGFFEHLRQLPVLREKLMRMFFHNLSYASVDSNNQKRLLNILEAELDELMKYKAA